jgi:outer membrane protein
MVKFNHWVILIFSFVSMGLGEQLTLAQAADTLKIGFIDAQKVLDNTKLGQKAKANLEEYVESRRKILELEQKDLKDLEEVLTKQGALLSLEARRDKQEAYQKKLEQYQKKALEIDRELQVKQLELVRGFRKELEGVVKKIAEKEGYVFVLDKDSETGNILYAKENFDLTSLVIAELDKTAK